MVQLHSDSVWVKTLRSVPFAGFEREDSTKIALTAIFEKKKLKKIQKW
jgi:hypothetical protein